MQLALLYLVVAVFLPSPASSDEFRIAWLAPNVTSSGTSAPSTVGALALALEHIEANGILPGDNFTVTWKNSHCDKKKAISSIYEVLVVDQFSPDLVIGPPCSSAMTHVGELAGYRNLAIFGWLSESSSFSDKLTYNSLVRSYGPDSSIAEFLVDFLEYMTWYTVELISTTSYSSVGEGIYEAITAHTEFTLVRWQDGAADQETEDNIKSYYDTLKKEARIVLLAVPSSSLRTWMLAAYDSDMVAGDFVFLVVNQDIPSVSLRDSVLDESFIQSSDGRDSDARQAYENVLMVTQSMEFVETLPSFKTQADSAGLRQTPSNLGLSSFTASSSDDTSPFLHDAVILWAQLVNESKAEGLTKPQINGSYLQQKAQNRAFSDSYWATGQLHMDENGDRKPDFWVLDLGSGGEFGLVVESQLESSAGGSLSKVLNEVGTFIWGDGTTGYDNRPKDVPDCGFEDEHCPNNLPYILPPVIIGVLIILGVITFFVIRKYQFEQSIKQMRWKIEKEEIHLKADRKYMGSNFLRMSRASSLRQSRASRVGQDRKYLANRSRLSSAGESSNSSGDQGTQQLFIQVALFRRSTVAVKVVRRRRLKMSRELLVELRHMTDMKHSNLACFIGATTELPTLYEVWEYCPKGSLEDIIFNDSVKLDNIFKFSLASDILKGLKYIHKSAIGCHGNLKSSNCIVDGRWVCKLCDYGLAVFHADTEDDRELSDFKKFSRLFWASPEILRKCIQEKFPVKMRSQEGDVYAASVILKELFSRTGPYTEYEDQYTTSEIIEKVASTSGMKPFRPDLREVKSSKLPPAVIDLIQKGWHEDPAARPTASHMLKQLEKANPNKSSNVLDNIMRMLETYSNNLEGLVQERARQVGEEKLRSEALLYRMLPRSVAENLKKGLHVAPEMYDAVSIYFSDIVSFTSLASKSTPLQVVTMLNELYTEFDSITNQHDVYKVETIGDAYMYVSGLPVRNDDRHAVEVTNCAMDLLSYVTPYRVPHIDNYELRIRIGLHTGPVVAGVVGVTMPRYCLFGDSVTIASSMESGGSPMRIHFSESTFQYLSKYSGYHVAERGFTEIKGKKFKTYFIVQRQDYSKPYPDFDELATSDSPPCKKLPVTSGKMLQVLSARPSLESGYYESDLEEAPPKQRLVTGSLDQTGDDKEEVSHDQDTDLKIEEMGKEINKTENVKNGLVKSSSNGKNLLPLSPRNKVAPVLPAIRVQDVES